MMENMDMDISTHLLPLLSQPKLQETRKNEEKMKRNEKKGEKRREEKEESYKVGVLLENPWQRGERERGKV